MVCTAVGVTLELSGGRECDFALLVPPQDRASFGDATDRLLADAALRTRMGACAHSAVQAQYSLAAEARQYVDVFVELTPKRDRARQPFAAP
jgi:glycosyltransferase involved in cell wall biosynthesis